jgi:hypothetical protein
VGGPEELSAVRSVVDNFRCVADLVMFYRKPVDFDARYVVSDCGATRVSANVTKYLSTQPCRAKATAVQMYVHDWRVLDPEWLRYEDRASTEHYLMVSGPDFGLSDLETDMRHWDENAMESVMESSLC